MTNKNPYEIRLDILKLAQEMLESNRRSQEKYYTELSELVKLPTTPSEVIVSFVKTRSPPIQYTENDILSMSNTLYSFVDSKTKT
jgi:hypothetical protein